VITNRSASRHQRLAFVRPLPLAQQQAVGESHHDLVVAAVGAGMEHGRAEAAVRLANGGSATISVGPLQELGLVAQARRGAPP
jgi:hypothetical protein